jgi:hypothetical protein
MGQPDSWLHPRCLGEFAGQPTGLFGVPSGIGYTAKVAGKLIPQGTESVTPRVVGSNPPVSPI